MLCDRQAPGGITLSGYMQQRYHSKGVHGAYLFELSALAVLSTAVQLLAGAKILWEGAGRRVWVPAAKSIGHQRERR